MKLIVLLLISVLAYAAQRHPVNEGIINEIKQSGLWEPAELSENKFLYMSVEEIKAMMGTKLDQNYDVQEVDVQLPEGFEALRATGFDARKKWKDKIHPIRDQGKCGSCWAFGATEVLSDRYAIEKNKNVILSPQLLVSCDGQDFGCHGGSLPNAWKYLERTGAVTDQCYPYTSGEAGDDGNCYKQCDDGSEFKYYKADKAQTSTTPFNVEFEISTSGPVEAAFTVYEDFLSYKSGIYEHVSGSMLGGHAIKCIGYGNEKGVDYWLMANSWGTDWGESGFFRIKQGTCGVDKNFIWARTAWMSDEMISE